MKFDRVTRQMFKVFKYLAEERTIIQRYTITLIFDLIDN